MDDVGILWVEGDEQDYVERAEQGWQFSDAVDPADWPIRRTQLAVIVASSAIRFLAAAHRGHWVATRKRLMTFRLIRSIEPIELATVLARMPARHRGHLSRNFEAGGGVVPPATWRSFLSTLFELSSEAEREASALLDGMRRPNRQARREEAIEVHERDALLLSLSIAGISRDRVPFATGKPAHFLENLTHRLPEDAEIVHDVSRMPGFEFVRDFPGTAIQFRGRGSGQSLTVMNVNRRPLETTTGVDLIYYRHEPDAFVLVQYKRLSNERGRWVYRPAADRHLAKEVARMDAMKLPSDSASSPKAYRLSDKPFFIKLCKPDYADQTPDQLIAGMYIPLEYWKVLDASPTSRGPRGGTVIGYDTAERWLSNSLFTDLVREAWIGTSGAAPKQIAELIESSLTLGKSAIVSMEAGHSIRRRRR